MENNNLAKGINSVNEDNQNGEVGLKGVRGINLLPNKSDFDY